MSCQEHIFGISQCYNPKSRYKCFFIALNAGLSISAQLFFKTGSQIRRRIIAIEKVKQHLGSQLSTAFLGFHSFTGIIMRERSVHLANTVILTNIFGIFCSDNPIPNSLS